MDTTLTLAQAAPSSGAASTNPRDLIALGTAKILRVPLAGKLLGANIGVAGAALIIAAIMSRAGAASSEIVTAMAAALLVGTAINIALTWLALRPIREIEKTIWRLWHGHSDVRVAASPVADTNLRDIGHTVNALLDHLDRDRDQMKELAREVIRAEDRERVRISEELRESIAQSLAAVTYQLSAVVNDCRDPLFAARLAEVRVLAGRVLDEVDVLSHSVHPRVLNDLGLVAGLRRLARDVTNTRVRVDVRVIEGSEDAQLCGLGMDTTSALYRVAQEAVQNALRHANANRIRIDVGYVRGAVTVSVTDDGTGFDVNTAERRRPGMGLFTMRQRAELIGATLTIDPKRGQGTTVQVTMPPAADYLYRPQQPLDHAR